MLTCLFEKRIFKILNTYRCSEPFGKVGTPIRFPIYDIRIKFLFNTNYKIS